MIFLNFIILISFSILLIKATDILISSLRSLAEATKIGKYAITGLILAIATSLPELFVGIVSALEGAPVLSLGNVIGSNIANITLVIAIGSFVAGGVVIRGKVVFRDIGYVFLISISPLLLLIDKTLSRVDGLLLLVLYAFYVVVLLQKRVESHEEKKEKGVFYRFFRRVTYSITGHGIEWIKLFGGILLLIFSADMIVKQATVIAESFNIPVFLIGIFMVAVGTSFPEIVFTVKALKKKEASMAFGDILGSVVANASLVLGITSIISPITITAFSDYLIAVGVFLFSFGMFVIFIRTKKRLDRWKEQSYFSYMFCLL